ncbi:uncharacterized protein LOC117586125 [Drosophila guanche]|uniref:Uncharacterized protein n=1 Tax=Drosophila guanche TaxID=7266 RepID=A0A3B0KEH1_DROGU|nr:uncharacterized protein LOC117586125 [Drosophila guanche]SPP84086.1 Hypothetical predicted protein [Drosophila guanche]
MSVDDFEPRPSHRDSRGSVGGLSKRSTNSAASILRGHTIPVYRAPALENMDHVSGFKTEVEQSLAKSMSSVFRQSTTNRRYMDPTLMDHEEWVLRSKNFRDEADVSQHPSYNIKTFSYDLNCYVRYLEAKEKYDRQFHREMQFFIASQSKAINQFVLRRVFCYNSLWPPLHTNRELNRFVTKFFQLTPKQKARLNYLMKTDLSLGS